MVNSINTTKFWMFLVGAILMLPACMEQSEPPPTDAPTPTREVVIPRNENVDALNAAQAALEEVDFGFAPLLRLDEASVIIEADSGVETARLAYPEQPVDPTAWMTVDSFVSAYAVRRILLNMPHVNRVALGIVSLGASVGQEAETVEHTAAWATFADRSRAVVDLTPLSTNFAPRHAPDHMLTDATQIETIFADRRAGVNLDQLQPLTITEVNDQLYYVLAKVLISYERYKFYLRTYPVKKADPIEPMDIRPGASVGVEIDRADFEELQELLIEEGPSAFEENPDLLIQEGQDDELLIEVQNDQLGLLWHLITKFKHQPPDDSVPTATPTVTPTPSPTPTPTPTPTPRKVPLITS